ncbi:hypothetical protein B0H66DRAFT_615262 [Apodospora peruviana]|uniref:Uncharacterized protein n=1 Tax=Apodospora peruviana TaxID=516989 RepID=A0AAE0IIH9_9PEZI|nr:hypothetical protein B0H66DRAFT_615262 [Apodospora peruviana]
MRQSQYYTPGVDVWADQVLDDENDNEDEDYGTTKTMPSGLLTPATTLSDCAHSETFTQAAVRAWEARTHDDLEDTTSIKSGAPSIPQRTIKSRIPDGLEEMIRSRSSVTSSQQPRSRSPSPLRTSDFDSAHQHGMSTTESAQYQKLKKQLVTISIIPIFAFIAVALIGWWMIPVDGGKPGPIDAFVASQDDWVHVTNLVTEYDRLPLEIKGGESRMTDLMISVKYSELPGKDLLVKDMQQCVTVAERVVDNLIDWNSLAGDTVDRIQNMNYHALTAYRGLQSMASWAVIPAPAAGDIGVIATIQHVGHALSLAVVGDKEKKGEMLQKLFIQEADRAKDQLADLKLSGTALAHDLSLLAYHLKSIATTARAEQAQLNAEMRELLSGIWGYLGFNDYAVASLGTQADMLALMAEATMQGNGYIGEVMGKIRKIDKDFTKLYKALEESKWSQAGTMSLRLDNIQSAIDKLDHARRSSTSRLQGRQYMALRLEM